MRSRIVLLALWLPALAGGACRPDEKPAPTPAGVTEDLPAVHSDEPESPDDGGVLGAALFRFHDSSAVALSRLSDGRWLTVGAESRLLTLYDAYGRRLSSTGAGGNPEGLGSPANGWRMTGDSILVAERLGPGGYRMVVFGPDGRRAREWKLVDREGRAPEPLCLVDGRFILTVRSEPPSARTAGRVREPLTAVLFRLDGTEAARRRGFVGRELEATADRRFRQVVYGQTGCWACGRSRIWYGDSDRFALLQLDTLLRPVRSIDRAWDPVMVRFTSEEALALGLRSGIVEPDSLAGEPVIARTYPAFDRIVDLGPEGLWVAGYSLPGEPTVAWSVFGEDGRWIADTDLPVHLVPRYLSGDTLAGIVRTPATRPVAALWLFLRRNGNGGNQEQ